MKPYTPIIGMEVHIELKTASKMFCGCKNDPFFAPQPNIYTCPNCLGLPGALPVPNSKAIEWTIKLGLALGCKINLFSHFDRKHYFYPDLAKGYQLSQYDQPFCYDGKLETEMGVVRIHRIHLEEDTGKLIHKTVNGKKVSLIDFNRSGVPLVEVVTEADIRSAAHAKAYTKALRSLVRYLDIAECDMEQGGMRLEANVSLSDSSVFTKADTSFSESDLPKYKVEVKNINSFRFLEHAIEFEIERQQELLDKQVVPKQETRGWSEAKSATVLQRSKETSADYRYFPDPDIPPLVFKESEIEKIRAGVPELPSAVTAKWSQKYDLDSKSGEFFTETQKTVSMSDKIFSQATDLKLSVKNLASAMINKKLKDASGNPLNTDSSTNEILTAFQKMSQVDKVDDSELKEVVRQILNENAPAVAQYKEGKTQILGFFMGQVQRKLGKKLDMSQLQSVITECLA